MRVDEGLQECGIVFLCLLALCMYVVGGGGGLVNEHLLGEDYNVVVVFPSFGVVCSLREGICSYIGDSWDMFDDEIIFGEVQEFVGDASADFASFFPILKVRMASVDDDFVGGSH